MEFCFNGTELEFHLLKILNTGWCWGLGFTEITRPNVKLLLKQGLWLRLKFRVGEKTWKEKKSLRIAQLLKLALVWLAVYFYLLGLWCGWGFVLEHWWYSVRKSKTVKDFKKTKIRKHKESRSSSHGQCLNLAQRFLLATFSYSEAQPWTPTTLSLIPWLFPTLSWCQWPRQGQSWALLRSTPEADWKRNMFSILILPKYLWIKSSKGTSSK